MKRKILKRISKYCTKCSEINVCHSDIQKHVSNEKWCKYYIFFAYRLTQNFSNTLQPMGVIMGGVVTLFDKVTLQNFPGVLLFHILQFFLLPHKKQHFSYKETLFLQKFNPLMIIFFSLEKKNECNLTLLSG